MRGSGSRREGQGPVPARVLIVDDHPVMREGLRTLVSRQHDLAVCGEAETARQALEFVANLKPDLVYCIFDSYSR